MRLLLDYALAATDVQYVRFRMTSNYRINNSLTDLVGLSEVRFQEAAAAVPEPSTLILAALGLAGLGLAGWRRAHCSRG